MMFEPGPDSVAYLQTTPDFTRPIPRVDFQQETFAQIMTAVNPNGKPNVLFPSNYIVVLELSAANAKPVKKSIEVEFNGRWSSDPASCISIRKL